MMDCSRTCREPPGTFCGFLNNLGEFLDKPSLMGWRHFVDYDISWTLFFKMGDFSWTLLVTSRGHSSVSGQGLQG